MSMEIGNRYGGCMPGTGGAEKTPAKRTEAEYYEQLRDKFDCVKDGKVSISPIYLRSCANDPEKAKELEENLSFFKESCESGEKSARAYLRSLGDELVSYSESWDIDAKGNVTMITQTTGRTGGGTKDYKEQRAELDKKLAEKREKKRLEEKKAQQKAKAEKLRVKLNKLDVKA